MLASVALLILAGLAGRALGNASAAAAAAADTRTWLDPSRPVAERVEALLQALTLDQKVAQLSSNATQAGVPEMKLSGFDWWTECLHGFQESSRLATAVMYPMPLSWAATFDPTLVGRVATEIGDEMRAFSNAQMRAGRPPNATNCFGPHVTLVRDPRWGRTAETFGEDPRLASDLTAAFVTGLQGGPGNGTYLKVAATCKHLLANDLDSWQNATRFNFNARVDARDMRDTHLPPFQACVKAGAATTMCSYNAVNGVPSCLNSQLLTGTLRGGMGFKGHVVTDCYALSTACAAPPNGTGGFCTQPSPREAAQRALLAGVDLVCNTTSGYLNVSDVAESVITQATRRVLTTRVRLGHFDPPNRQPWGNLPLSVVGAPSHRQTARLVAQKSIVLLKNAAGAPNATALTLPLNASALTSIACVGPFAAEKDALLGNYARLPKVGIITPLDAIRAAVPPTVNITFDVNTAWNKSNSSIAADVARCQASDLCLLFLGSHMKWGGGEVWYSRDNSTRHAATEEGEALDRTTLLLNTTQQRLYQAILAAPNIKSVVVVLVHGGPLDVSELHCSPKVGAILSAGYPGEGAAAIADVLFGRVSPSGRLPVTWYRESYTVLPMTDMRMRSAGAYPGRTHRYWRGVTPLYPFGYGLSYTNFSLASPALAAKKAAGVTVTVRLTNTGKAASESVVLALLNYAGPAAGRKPAQPSVRLGASGCDRRARSTPMVEALAAYQRSRLLAPGASQVLSLWLGLQAQGTTMSSWAGFGDPAPPCGIYELRFGPGQPAAASVVLE